MLTDVDWKNARLPMSLIACSLPGQPKWARAFSWPFRASCVSLSLPLLASRGVSLLLASRTPSWPHLASLGLSRPHVASPGIAWPPLPAASSPSLALRRLSRPPLVSPWLKASTGLPWPLLAPRWPQDGPRSPQDGPTMVPRRLKMAPKVATMAPRWPHETWP